MCVKILKQFKYVFCNFWDKISYKKTFCVFYYF